MTKKQVLLVAVITSILTTLVIRAFEKPQFAAAQVNSEANGASGRFQYSMHPVSARHQFIVDTQTRRCWTPITYLPNTPNELTVWEEMPFSNIMVEHDDFIQRHFDREKERTKGAAGTPSQPQPLTPRN